AFSHFLNLSNIVDQHHSISREMDDELSATQTLEDMFNQLIKSGHSKERIGNVLSQLNIELVLTAHPTEITRRSMINKHAEIDQVLSQLELQGHTSREVSVLHRRLAELIAQIWNTGDFREHRPSPVDEARWGFSVIENSLWHAVPAFMRRLHNTSMAITGEYLPLEFTPVTFTFWMGGDRDGNPNVTARVTREVLLLSRWKAIDLYLQDIQELIDELSMYRCSPELAEMAQGAREPYRYLLRQLRELLRKAKSSLEAELQGR
ncbi:MAG: phosphoenolpyruvate carboxylase, partial [Pseudomonadales bacterium]